MLNFFRQKGLTSVVYGAVIVATLLVFVLGFSPTAGKKLGSVNETCAARVRGSCIEPKAHRSAYHLIFSRGSGGLREAVASRVALEGLIERELLIGEAERLGLTVTKDEITNSLFENWIYFSLPSDNIQLQQSLGLYGGRMQGPFKDPKSKKFDMKLYEKQVKSLLGQQGFREWQTRELLASKMRDLVKAPVRVADDEAWDRYGTERTNAVVNYVVVRKNWIEKYAVSADPKDVDAWAKDKANFGQIIVPVRHILVKADKGEERAAAKTKADGIFERVKKGEDFAKLAKEFSDDPGSKDKGGMYDGEMVERFVEPFRKAVESVKPGELVPSLVETDFGWHIIKRDDASKDDVAKAYKKSKSTDLSKVVAQKIAADIKGGKPAEDAIKAAIAQYAIFKPAAAKPEAPKGDAKDGGAPEAPAAPVTADQDPERPQFLTSNAFNRGGNPIPAVSADTTESVVKFAFGAKPGEIAEPIRTDDGFVVAQLKEQKPATREDFEKDRDAYMQGLIAAKQAEALAHYVRRLREAEKGEVKIDENNVLGAKGDAGAGPTEEDDEGP